MTETEEKISLSALADEAHRECPSNGKEAGDYYQKSLEEIVLPNVSPDIRDVVADLILDSRRCRISDARHTDFRRLKTGYVEGPMARGSRAIRACAVGLLDWDVYGKRLR